MTVNLQLLEGFQGLHMTVLLDNFYFTHYSLVTKHYICRRREEDAFI